MAITRKKREPEGLGRVLRLPVEAIAPNPAQPRQLFDEAALGELAESIVRYIREHALNLYDVTDERQTGSRRD